MRAGAHLSWQVGLPRWLFVSNSPLMSRHTGREVKGRDSGKSEGGGLFFQVEAEEDDEESPC